MNSIYGLIASLFIMLLLSGLNACYADNSVQTFALQSVPQSNLRHSQPIYQIELLIFKHPINDRQTTVSWKDFNDLKSQANALQLNSTQSNRPQRFFQSLPHKAFILKNEANRINRSKQFILLKHVAWLQSLQKKNNSQPVLIMGGQTYNNDSNPISELGGTISLSLGRYINIKTNLILTEPTYAGYKSINMTEARRMRPNQLNYFDNPAFGMLVMIKSLETNNNYNSRDKYLK